MKALCITPCGRAKIWDRKPDAGPTPARDVYTGSFARACQRYAARFHPDHWLILSAKYGFLWPEEQVPGPYDVTFNDPRTRPIDRTALARQVQEKGLDDYNTIVVLAGKRYLHMVAPLFPQHKVLAPLQGYGGMGYMIQALTRAITDGVPLRA